MSIVIDLNLVCVICLRGGELRSVFERDETTKQSISDKIMKCTDLFLEENSKLPDKICSSCLQDLTAADRFRQNWASTYAIFRSIQEHEDALASYELQQHKIKIPTGLKIKRIQPETSAYYLPVEREVTKAKPTQQDYGRDGGTEPSEYSMDDVDDEQNEEVEIDYYEGEEVLDEQFEGEIVEIKVEKQQIDDVVSPAASKKRRMEEKADNEGVHFEPKTGEIAIKKEEEDDADMTEEGAEAEAEAEDDENHDDDDDDDDDENRDFDEDDDTFTEENIPPPPPVVAKPKRGRGRPRKVVTTLASSTRRKPTRLTAKSSSSASVKVKAPEKGTARRKYRKLETAPASSPSSTALMPLTTAVTSRKRKSMHGNAKPTKICEFCGNSYKYQHALIAHMRRHTNDRPFSCEFCEKAFVSAVELRRHMRVHTGHKPYSCKYCERRFSDFGSRIKHERTHTGERPYTCTTCNKTFAYAHVLSVHLRTHTGEKRFKCDGCNKGFTKKAYLEAHMEQHAFAALDEANMEADQQQIINGTVEIKDVAGEECIFTTEYIVDEAMTSEEHLEEAETNEEQQIPIY